MADGFIVRKGGVAVDLTAPPSLTFVSKTQTEIVFTITNNDTETVDIFWEVDDTTPDANTLSLAGGATSSNQTASGLTQNTQFVIHAFANAAEKAGSQTVTLTVTTEPLLFIEATGGTTLEYDSGGSRYKTHTFTSSETFSVTEIGNGPRNVIDYIIIGGPGVRGGSGTTFGPGGGGGGGYLTTIAPTSSNVTPNPQITPTVTDFSIEIGALGGGVSTAFSISANGGGNGGNLGGGGSGASGGGGGGSNTFSNSGGGSISGQGRNGGNGAPNFNGGGGGGAGGTGGNATSSGRGAGGVGLVSTLRTGNSETRGGGGVGGSENNFQAPSNGNGSIVIIRYEIEQI